MGIKFNPLIFSGLDLTGGTSLAAGTVIPGTDANSILAVDSANKLTDIVLTDGQLIIGSTGNFPVKSTLTGTTNQVSVASAPGSITLSLPQNIHTGASPVFANLSLAPSGALDTTAVGTLAIGTANANVINIGNSGATVNIQGTTIYENVTQLQVKDPLITINKGGAAGSASNSGLEIEENSIITAYVETSADRASWSLKAPSTTGVITLTPGSAGFTLNQGSHDPLTLTAVGSTPNANGASLSSQALTLQPANGTNPGIVTTGVQTFGGNKTFSGTIAASNLSGTNTGDQTITLTGDITGSGTGSFATTLATVNSTTGSYGSATAVATFTVNAKGLVTASGSTSIQIAESQVTNLVTDLAGKQPTGNYITGLTGDATASGPGSAAITLATVNTNTGSFGSASSVSTFTVNGKGLITAAASAPISIAASQVSSGLLAVARGGTGVDGSSAANGALLIGNGSGYTLATLTAGTGITITNTSGSISIANTSASAFDIAPATWTGLVNNTANQSITGFLLNSATVAFNASVYVAITASANTFSAMRISGVRKGADWSVNDLVTDINGDAVTGLAFAVTSTGQVQITIGNITGFTSASVKFRAQVLS